MEEFHPFHIYAAVLGIRYTFGLFAGTAVSLLEKKAEQGVDNYNLRRNLAIFAGVMDGMRIPLEMVLAGENANPVETTVRLSLEYLSTLAGIYTPKIIQHFKK